MLWAGEKSIVTKAVVHYIDNDLLLETMHRPKVLVMPKVHLDSIYKNRENFDKREEQSKSKWQSKLIRMGIRVSVRMGVGMQNGSTSFSTSSSEALKIKNDGILEF